MDVLSDVPLSLDELTVEIYDNDDLKQDTLFDHSGNKPELHFNQQDCCSQENISDSLDFDEDGSFETKEFVQVDSHHIIPVGHTTNLITCSSQQREMISQLIDSGSDTAILSIVKDIKENVSSDSDSEFEVPDRPAATLPDKTCIQPVKHDLEIPLSETLTSQQYVEKTMKDNIFINKQSSPSESSISISHEVFTLFHQSSKILPMSIAQNTLLFTQRSNPVSEVTTIAETPSNLTTNITEECVKGEEKSDQNSSPKSDFHDDNTYRIKHQPSVSTVKEQRMFIGTLTTENDTNDAKERSKPSIVTIAEEWEEVEIVEPGFLQTADKLAGSSLAIESKPLALFSDTWTLFVAADYTPVKPQIKTHIERHGFSALKHMLFGPPKLHRDLLSQKELIFCIAATQFDNDNEIHIRVLQTIYRCLTGSKFDCQRFGDHWEEIGFQGRDPATDLRGTGMLALLHLLFFLQSSCTKGLAKDVYKLSLHPMQNFPFCLMSINLSRISLQVLREDVFNRECNNNRDVISTINKVYAALFLHLYREWKKGKTIVDSGFVLQEIEKYCHKHSKSVLKDLSSYEKTRKQKELGRKDSDTELMFYNVCKDDKTDGKLQKNNL